MDRTNITITTAGACSGNPGFGGYAAVLRFGNYTKNIVGSAERTNNNRMELKAVIESVKALKKPCLITIQTDSQYICNGIANAKEREANNWHTKTGARCANFDMWQELSDLKKAGQHRFQYLYVKTTAEGSDSNVCSKLAKEQLNRRA